MKRLTVAGRLLITALIIGAIFVGYKYFGGKQAIDKLAEKQGQSIGTDSVAQENTAAATEDVATDNPEKHLLTQRPSRLMGS